MNKHTQPWSGNSQLRNLSLQLYVSTRSEKVALVPSDKMLISNSESSDADFYVSFANILGGLNTVYQLLPTANNEPLSGNKTLTSTFEQHHFLDPNGADRNVTAWAGPTNGQMVVIKNDGTANTLQFKNNGGSSIGDPIEPGFSKTFIYSGVEWQEIAVTDRPSVYRDAALSGNVTLTAVAGNNLFLDPNGADRDVTAEASPVTGRIYKVKNIGSANTLQFKNSGGTEIGDPIPAGLESEFQYDGTAWIELSALNLLSADNTWTGRQSVSEVALTSTSNSVAIDASQGNSFYHLLTENTTFAGPTNLKSGTYNFLIKQDASSAYTLAFNSAFLFPDGVDPVMTTTLGGLMLVSCMYSESASALVCTSIKDFS